MEVPSVDSKVLRGSYLLEDDNPNSDSHPAIMLVSAYIGCDSEADCSDRRLGGHDPGRLSRSLSGRTAVKHRQKTILGLFISILSLLLTTTPTLAEPKVTVIPSSLTVIGTRCLVFNFGCATVKRNLLLRTNKALTSLQILSVDLNRADGATVVPATATRPTLPANSAQPDQALTIPVQFNFSQINSLHSAGKRGDWWYFLPEVLNVVRKVYTVDDNNPIRARYS